MPTTEFQGFADIDYAVVEERLAAVDRHMATLTTPEQRRKLTRQEMQGFIDQATALAAAEFEKGSSTVS